MKTDYASLYEQSKFPTVRLAEDPEFTEEGIQAMSDEHIDVMIALLERMLDHKSFPVIFIHDDFKAHPNNLNVVRQTYIDIMAEIAESNMLEFILSTICKEPVKIEKYSDDLGELIREGNYALS